MLVHPDTNEIPLLPEPSYPFQSAQAWKASKIYLLDRMVSPLWFNMIEELSTFRTIDFEPDKPGAFKRSLLMKSKLLCRRHRLFPVMKIVSPARVQLDCGCQRDIAIAKPNATLQRPEGQQKARAQDRRQRTCGGAKHHYLNSVAQKVFTH